MAERREFTVTGRVAQDAAGVWVILEAREGVSCTFGPLAPTDERARLLEELTRTGAKFTRKRA